MKKTNPEELRPEYYREDLGPGVLGKYLDTFRSGTNLVLLQPDVAKAFPTEEAVNDALRSFMYAEKAAIENTLCCAKLIMGESDDSTSRKSDFGNQEAFE